MCWHKGGGNENVETPLAFKAKLVGESRSDWHLILGVYVGRGYGRAKPLPPSLEDWRTGRLKDL